jgi:hypothetical protein
MVEEKRLAGAEVSCPRFRRPENLIPFAVSATTDNKFMIDSESLSVAATASSATRW